MYGRDPDLDHLDEQTRKQVEYLAKKWTIPRKEALILLESQRHEMHA